MRGEDRGRTRQKGGGGVRPKRMWREFSDGRVRAEYAMMSGGRV